MRPEGVDWGRLYARLTASICAIDCGTLCAPRNGGEPACCRNEQTEPVLYTDELAWLETRTDLWRRKPRRTAADRRQAAEIEDYVVFACCRGIARCRRRHRSLACRFFPLEPHFAPGKRFVGLTYVYRAEGECPLVDHPEIRINPAHVDQAMAVWEELFAAFPREIDAYVAISRGLRARMRRRGREIPIFGRDGSVRRA
jgi:hypothetical protein